ncbi:MAG: threonine/serine exporter family protein [Xanthomonadales bacterium]|nr:threonine/serine exporter family protein [Xanthomonadales bacterium]
MVGIRRTDNSDNQGPVPASPPRSPIQAALDFDRLPAVPADSREQIEHDSTGLLITLGRALLSLGSPSHRVEAALELMAARLGLSAQFFSSPTALFVAINREHQQQTYLARVSASSPDMGKLSDIAEVINALEQRELGPQQAAAQVQEIFSAPSRYSAWLTFLAFPLVALPATLLLGGGIKELPLAGILSSLVGFLAIITGPRHQLGRLLIPLASMLTAFIATLWCGYEGHTAMMPALIAGMIVLLPGLDLTTATRELSTGHLVSGSARLAATALVFATIAFGLALGSAMGQYFVGEVPNVQPQQLPLWLVSVSLVFAAVGLAIILRVRVRQWPWVLLACALAWGSAQFGQMTLGGTLGAFVGGVLVGLYGNAYARLTNLPGSTLQLPGLLLLVPGSVGMRSMTALLGADVLTGIEVAFTAILTAVALATGMITASVILPPRNEL